MDQKFIKMIGKEVENKIWDLEIDTNLTLQEMRSLFHKIILNKQDNPTTIQVERRK